MASIPDDQSSTKSVTHCPDEDTKEPSEEKEIAANNHAEPIESNKTDNASDSLFGNRAVNICSPFGMQNSHKPVFGSNRSILKPSALFTDANVPSPSVTFGNNVNKSVKLKPSVLSNPFTSSKAVSNDSNSNCDDKQTSLPASEKPDSTNLEEVANSSTATSGLMFVPLTSPTNASTNTSAVSSTTNSNAALSVSNSQSACNSTSNIPSSTSVGSEFVFGQNIHERVARQKDDVQEPVIQNGITSSEMLFSSAMKQDSKNVSHEFSNGNSKTLSISAKEYEEARSVKRKYEEVAVVTGEEDEHNILQVNCKLFAFDNHTSNWTERGRGTLRVNDKEVSEGRSSRLVMRLLGNLRVVLNTKIWGEMTVELASKKSVRLTAIDSDGQVRIYLVTANPKDAEQLYNVLNTRIQKKKLKPSSEESTSKAPSDD